MMTSVTRHRSTLLTIAAVLGCLIALWSTNERLQHSLPRAGIVDFPIFTEAANKFLATGFIYDRDLTQYSPTASVFKFPPLSGSILVIALKSGFTEPALKKAGAILQVASFFLGIFWLTIALMPENKKMALVVALCLTSALLPTVEENILRLQIEPALLFLFITAAICTINQKNFIAGFMIGTAAMLKIYPVGAMIFFVAAKRWNGLKGFMLAVMAIMAFTVLTLGYTENVFYASKILPILLKEDITEHLENISLVRLGDFLLGEKPARILSTTILLSFLVFSLRRGPILRKTSTKAVIALEFSAYIPVILLGMKNSMWNYQILLTIPITILTCLLVQNTFRMSKKLQIFLGIGLALSLSILHISASITVDHNFSAPPPPLYAIITMEIARILVPPLVFIMSWQAANTGQPNFH